MVLDMDSRREGERRMFRMKEVWILEAIPGRKRRKQRTGSGKSTGLRVKRLGLILSLSN